jgi:RND superfamily putative drug exporter
VGLAAAILLDATVIRAVVLPSLMTLLGPANWWTPRLLRGRGRHAAGGPAARTGDEAPQDEQAPELVGAG